jgi:MFS family permease
MAAPSNRKVRIMLGALVLAELVSAAEAGMIYGALPALLKAFQNPVVIGWMLTAVLLVQAVAAALCGRAGDIFGRKGTLLFVLGMACMGSLLSIFWPTAEGVIAGRAIQGLSGAILPLCHGLVRENFPKERVEFGVGVIAASAVVLGGALGGLGGAVIANSLGWQYIFYFTSAASLVAIVAIAFGLPASARAPRREPIKVFSGIAFAPATAGLLFAITRAKEWGWQDQRVLSLLAISLVVLVWWVCHQMRQKNPLIDVRLLANPQIAMANVVLALMAIGSFNAFQLVFMYLPQPLWTGAGLGTAALTPGILVAIAMSLAFVAGPLAGRMARARGPSSPLLAGSFLLLAAWSIPTVYHGNIAAFCVILCLHSFGTVMCYSAVPMVIIAASPPERTSEANGLSVIVRSTSHAIGSQLIALLLASSTVSIPGAVKAVKYPMESAYQLAFVFVAATCLVKLAVAWALWQRTRPAPVDMHGRHKRSASIITKNGDANAA